MSASGRSDLRDERSQGLHRRRAGVSAALMGMTIGLLVAAIVASFWTRFPFPVVAVAERVANLTPGGIATFFIELLQKLALPFTVVATAVGLAVTTVLLGRLLPRARERVGATALAAGLLSLPLWLVAIVAYDPSGATVARGTYGVVLFGCVLVGTVVTWLTYDGSVGPAVGGAEPRDVTRRAVVRAAWLGATALVLGWVQPVRFLFPSRRPAAKLAVEPIVIVEPPPSSPGFDAIEGLAPRVTALEDFYVVDEAIVDPDVDPAVWRLRVFGHVDTPFELTYDELLGLPAVEQYATLECISNVVGGDLISTARWTGIAMPYLLGRAGASAGAVEVVFRAVGGYSDSIPITVATRDDVLVAIGMNGRELPREHGFPARLLAPGYFGMKQPKWLESIEVVDQPYVGYWERRGWIKAAVVKTMSRIDTVAEIGGGSVVAGVAFSGIRGISRVEVSLDGGAKWEEAELEATLSAQTWRRWRSRAFDPAGVEEIRVRATDGRGETQTSRVEDPHPSGATGWHMVGV